MPRRRKSFRRHFRMRGRHHSPGMASKLTSGIALLIGLSPVLETGLKNLPSGNIEQFRKDVVFGYTAGFSEGGFSAAAATNFYGSLVGAVLFKKAMSFLLKRAKLKL